MSTGWKVGTWILVFVTVFGVLGNIGKDTFWTVLLLGAGIVAVCVKCLELAKELENKQ